LQQAHAAKSELSALKGHGNDDTTRLLRGYFYTTAAQAAAGAGDRAAHGYAEEAARIFGSSETDAGSGRVRRNDLAGALNGLGNIEALLADYHAALANYRRATNLVPDYACAWHDTLLAELALAKQGEIDLTAMQRASVGFAVRTALFVGVVPIVIFIGEDAHETDDFFAFRFAQKSPGRLRFEICAHL
jgi:hypothetical protein